MTKRTCTWYLKRGLPLNGVFLMALIAILWVNSGARSSGDCSGGWLWTLMLVVGAHVFLHLIQGLMLLSCIHKEGWVRCGRDGAEPLARSAHAVRTEGRTGQSPDPRVERQRKGAPSESPSEPPQRREASPVPCPGTVVFHLETPGQIPLQGVEEIPNQNPDQKDSPSIAPIPTPVFPEKGNEDECGYVEYQIFISRNERGFELRVLYEWEVIIAFFFLLASAFYITIFFATLENSKGEGGVGVTDNCPSSYPSLWVFSYFVLVYIFAMFIKHFLFLFRKCRHSHSTGPESGHSTVGSCVVCV